VVAAGEEMSLTRAYLRLDDPDRAVREQAFLAVTAPEGDAELDELFLRALGLLRKMARNAGLSDYRAYRWRQLGRFDYTPQECHGRGPRRRLL
jgi:oligoendopeptidase F